jgi:ferrous iron transport protein B
MIDFFDILAGTFFIDGMSALMNSLGIHSLLTFMVAEGLGGGIQVIATFIPIIATLFLGLSILESTGYMARGAFVLDRLMRFIGLPGKSFVPLLIGFGCSVPSVMATRTLKHPRDRLLTVLLAPFMSCGAKLPVYALFASVFFADNSAMIVFGLYLIGMLIAIFTGLIIKNTLLPGETSPFFMELPTYHLPVFRNIVILTWHRLKDFIWGAGKIIVPMVLVLNLLNAVDTHGNLDPEGSQDSLLSIAGKTITPLFSGLGISEENWPASVGIFTGILAKEAVVGTLDALYSRMEETDSPSNSESDEEEEETFSLTQGISEAFSSLTQNFSELFGALLDPLGIGGSLEEAQESQSSTKTAMQNSFDSTSGAFAYLLFILLYMPCAAAMGAVYRETGGRWALFVATWSTGLAYSVSTLFYQISRFTVHPLSSSIWIVSIVCIATTVILLLKKKGDEQNTLSE